MSVHRASFLHCDEYLLNFKGQESAFHLSHEFTNYNLKIQAKHRNKEQTFFFFMRVQASAIRIHRSPLNRRGAKEDQISMTCTCTIIAISFYWSQQLGQSIKWSSS